MSDVLHDTMSPVALVTLASKKKNGAFKHTGLAGTVKLSMILFIVMFLRMPFVSLVAEMLRSRTDRF